MRTIAAWVLSGGLLLSLAGEPMGMPAGGGGGTLAGQESSYREEVPEGVSPARETGGEAAGALQELSGREEIPEEASPARESGGEAAGVLQESSGEEKASERACPGEGAASHPYVQGLVRETLEEIISPGMTDYEKVEAIYNFMVDDIAFDDPVGMELWRVHGGGDPIPYLENRSISPLRFRMGKCEDKSAAMVLLLRELGFEARYLPGFIFTLDSEPMDHAWVQVKLDGVWYHLDCDLEEYMSRRGTVRYRYFLKGDTTMRATHRWGGATLLTAWLTPEQKEKVSRCFLGESCPQDAPPPDPRPLGEREAADRAALEAQAAQEIAAYEKENGPLEPMELNITPPVFGWEGYGPVIE